jgi:site-specific recombinase XerD
MEATERSSRDALVSSNGRGEPWTEFALRLAFGRACKRARLDGWRFHDLRHFFVIQRFRGGAPAPAVQALAGHAELATTQLYAHVAALDLEDAIRKLTEA